MGPPAHWPARTRSGAGKGQAHSQGECPVLGQRAILTDGTSGGEACCSARANPGSPLSKLMARPCSCWSWSSFMAAPAPCLALIAHFGLQ